MIEPDSIIEFLEIDENIEYFKAMVCAMLKFHFSNNESFGADFSDFSDIFDAILVFNGGAFGFG